MHSQLEEFLIVGTILPTVLIHLLAEAVEGILEEGVRISIRKLEIFLLSQFDELRSDGARHLTTLTENHTPDGVVHHHVTPLALLHREEVHQGDVLRVL